MLKVLGPILQAWEGVFVGVDPCCPGAEAEVTLGLISMAAEREVFLVSFQV